MMLASSEKRITLPQLVTQLVCICTLSVSTAQSNPSRHSPSRLTLRQRRMIKARNTTSERMTRPMTAPPRTTPKSSTGRNKKNKQEVTVSINHLQTGHKLLCSRTLEELKISLQMANPPKQLKCKIWTESISFRA